VKLFSGVFMAPDLQLEL